MPANDSQPIEHSLLPVLAWPLLCLAVIFTGIALFLPVHHLPWAWPLCSGWNGSTVLAFPLAMSAALGAAVISVLGLGKARKDGLAGTFLELISPQLLFFASIWLILPASTGRVWIWLLATTLIAVTAWLYLRSKESWPAASRYFFSAKDALPDSLIVLLPILAGFWVSKGGHIPVDGGRLLSSLLLYPLYALFQLTIFLSIPATRMIKMGYSSRTIAVACAVVFSLAHWPNPLLMAVTSMVMLVWVGQFLRGRSILVLALVMGIAATGFRFMVPQQWTLDMRIGPDYIEKRAELSVSSFPGR